MMTALRYSVHVQAVSQAPVLHNSLPPEPRDNQVYESPDLLSHNHIFTETGKRRSTVQKKSGNAVLEKHVSTRAPGSSPLYSIASFWRNKKFGTAALAGNADVVFVHIPLIP